jgi:hypothetical protein
LAVEELFLDATFVKARKGGEEIGNTKCGKGMKLGLVFDRNGTLLSLFTDAANVSEIDLGERIVERIPLATALPDDVPLIADRAYDSDPLRQRWPWRWESGAGYRGTPPPPRRCALRHRGSRCGVHARAAARVPKSFTFGAGIL